MVPWDASLPLLVCLNLEAILLLPLCCHLSLQALGEALGTTADQGGPKAVKPLTEDWPFVD